MKEKKLLYPLLSLLIVMALAVPAWSTVVRADTPTEVSDWHGLDAIRNNLSGSYILVNDLDSTTPGYDELAGPAANEGKGWEPIGVLGDSFKGSFDGQGYEIKDLFIDRDDEDGVGLFGAIEGGSVASIGVVDVDVTGYDYVGGLVGDNFEGSVTNSYSSGTVIGHAFVGGLVGISDGVLSTSYSLVSVAGERWVGGLVGSNGGNVSNCYAAGSVTGDWGVGGLVGDNWDGTVSNCYSTGSVTGDLDVGGLVGWNDGAVGNSFWDTDTSGMEGSEGGTGKPTVEMMAIATFTDTATEGLDEPWSIATVASGESNPAHTWNIVAGETYPFLSWEETALMSIQLDLKAGWNLVSVPVIPVDPSVTAVFPGTEVVYAWNASTGGYDIAAEVEPSRGYWVAVFSDTVITVSGVPVYSWTHEIEPGWNLVGSVYQAVEFTTPDTDPPGQVEGFSYRWDPELPGYTFSNTIEPEMGHWIAATGACVLTLSVQDG